MKHELFLIAPGQGTADDFRPALNSALEIVSISALLLKQGERSEEAYAQFVEAIAPLAQQKGVAVLLDNRPELVRALGVDGVHMTGGIKAVREALDALKPDFIVGTGDIGARHEAMLRGELEIDYLMFGDRQVPEWTGADLANWWAETFEVASVYLAENVDDPAIANLQSEFLGLPETMWSDTEALARLAEAGK
ncbi:thiamine phosphate synthase [Pelagibacterium lentulum]|uniref:thiamine phosphate synthase n=1 Tax=Pelagibacterium lentulum TaxID=2029865 RepID=UPI000F8F2DBF|nr:thiamine phosphate synthase [Pelagibacterium lentulum]